MENIYNTYLQRCSQNKLFKKMQTILQALKINPNQINDFDDVHGLYVSFFENNKRYCVSIVEEEE